MLLFRLVSNKLSTRSGINYTNQKLRLFQIIIQDNKSVYYWQSSSTICSCLWKMIVITLRWRWTDGRQTGPRTRSSAVLPAPFAIFDHKNNWEPKYPPKTTKKQHHNIQGPHLLPPTLCYIWLYKAWDFLKMAWGSETLCMTSEGLGEMFEGDFTDTCTANFNWCQ